MEAKDISFGKTMCYDLLEILEARESLFDFGKLERIEALAAMHKNIFEKYAAQETNASSKKSEANIRESVVAFDVPE